MTTEERLNRLEKEVFGRTEEELYHSQSVRDVRLFVLYVDGDKKVSDNFKISEFACKDGTQQVLIHPRLVDVLEKIRKWAGGGYVVINSGYRTPSWNKKIGGADRSIHMLGMAADIVVEGKKPSEVYKYADEVLNMGGVGSYSSFTHIDVFGKNRRF